MIIAVEQAKEVDALGDSNVHGSDPINVQLAAHEEDKDGNPWPMTETTSKLLNRQGRRYADCTNSLNNFVRSHNGHADSIEEDPEEANSDEHVPRSPIQQKGSHLIFGHMLPCAYSKKYYTRPSSDGLDFLQENFILNVVLLFKSLFLLRLNNLLLFLVWKALLRISLHMFLTYLENFMLI